MEYWSSGVLEKAGILISILIVAISTAFGRKLLGLMRVKTDSPVESSIFGVGLGLGALAYLVLGVGLAGWLYPWVLAAILGLIVIVSFREIIALATEIGRALRDQAKAKLGFTQGLLAFSMAALGATVLISSLAPPSSLDWDGLAYHLAVPKVYLAKHAILYIPYDSHSNFPFLTEMLYTLGLAFKSINLAKLFHFWMYIGTAIAVYALCRRHLNPRIGSIGALLFMSVPVIVWEAGVADADITTALYMTLALYALLNWQQTRLRQGYVGQASWLILCGLMGGFALGTKVLAIVPIGVMCLWIIWSYGRMVRCSDGVHETIRPSDHQTIRALWPALAMGLVAVLVGSPWYIKSYIYTGNPVYPFLYGIFGGKYWSAGAAATYHGAQLAMGMGRGLDKLILLPWNLTMSGSNFFDEPGRTKLFSLIGPALLGLIPVYVLAGRRRKIIAGMGLISAVFLIAWFILMQQVRYLIPIMPMLCVVAACGVEGANSNWRIGRHVANGFLALCVVLSLLTGLLLSMVGARAALGLEPRSDYLSRTLDIYDAEMFINDRTPARARILIFDDARGFYLDRDYMWANPGHHEMTPWSRFKSGEDMVRYFMRAGFTYALINWKFADGGALHQTLIADAIGHGLMREVYGSHLVSVYELTE